MSSNPGSDPRRAHHFSLALRLSLWFAACSLALVLGVAGYSYWALSSNLDREEREFLADQIGILRVLLRNPDDNLGLVRHEVEVESSARPFARAFLRIVAPGEKVVSETPGIPVELGRDVFPAAGSGSDLAFKPGRIQADQGRSYRLAAAAAGLHRIQAALETTRGDQLLLDFRRRMIPALVVLLLLGVLVGHRTAVHGIDPVRRIARAADEIGSATLSRRVDTRDLPAEIAALAATINGMLERLEGAFLRLERFSADIAHELRTPLSNLRGEVEVALARPRSELEYREVLSSCLEEQERLTRLIETLLFLARAEDPNARVQREKVPIDAELERVREFYAVAAEEAGIELRVQADAGLTADLDRSLFQRAVGNLVENALAHTPGGGVVELRAAGRGGAVSIEVRDNGAGIPPEHLPHVFDRLYRGDQSRTPGRGGFGLGLSIVRSIVELHGGTARIESAPGQGTRVLLEFPREN